MTVIIRIRLAVLMYWLWIESKPSNFYDGASYSLSALPEIDGYLDDGCWVYFLSSLSNQFECCAFMVLHNVVLTQLQGRNQHQDIKIGDWIRIDLVPTSCSVLDSSWVHSAFYFGFFDMKHLHIFSSPKQSLHSNNIRNVVIFHSKIINQMLSTKLTLRGQFNW